MTSQGHRLTRVRTGFRAFGHHSFRLLWACGLLHQFGFWAYLISLQTLTVRLTGGDPTWLGIVFFASLIPLLVFSPVAGVLADRHDRLSLVRAGYAAIALLTSCLAILTLMNAATPVLIAAIALTIGFFFALNAPATHALVSASVPGVDLPSAVSLQSVAGNLTRVAGPLLAAPVLFLAGEGGAFALFAVTSLVVFILIGRIRPLLSHVKGDAQRSTLIRDVSMGFTYARRHPPALLALGCVATAGLTAGAYPALLPLFPEAALGIDNEMFLWLAAVTGAGALVGGILTSADGAGIRPRAGLGAAVIFGACVVLFAFAPTWNTANLLIALAGFFYFVSMTRIATLLQTLADEQHRGRLMSLYLMSFGGTVPIGGLWQGFAAERIGIPATLALAGAITVVYAVTALALGRSGGSRPRTLINRRRRRGLLTQP